MKFCGMSSATMPPNHDQTIAYYAVVPCPNTAPSREA